MRIVLYIVISLFIKTTFANEITIIELHNKSIDQVLIENAENANNPQSNQEIISEILKVTKTQSILKKN